MEQREERHQGSRPAVSGYRLDRTQPIDLKSAESIEAVVREASELAELRCDCAGGVEPIEAERLGAAHKAGKERDSDTQTLEEVSAAKVYDNLIYALSINRLG
ncbi:MAG: hypothetical protein CVT77_03515 [Alphaproteobacteria bacterium HGW-Alphaproteobacteria-16]|nr:MAG: hypothetical protein CVT77_03515 [Alphaproteobacteria bacterium HGW-Alphaproteobacteria-16]